MAREPKAPPASILYDELKKIAHEDHLGRWGDNDIMPYTDYVFERYHEDTNPDAIARGDKWLKSNTSFIWKVGVLLLIDNNKVDFVTAYIGHERKPGQFDYIGKLHWPDGENDDMGRCVRRYVECMARAFPAHFDDRD